MFYVNDVSKPFYKVYLLDDDQCTLDLIEAMLDADPAIYYEVTKFTSSPEALKAIIHNQPDILILDVNIPIMNGFEVCQKIKSNVHTAFITVVLITAYSSEFVWHDGLLLYHADYYLSKPFECESFIDHIHSVIKLKQGNLPGHKNQLISKSI